MKDGWILDRLLKNLTTGNFQLLCDFAGAVPPTQQPPASMSVGRLSVPAS